MAVSDDPGGTAPITHVYDAWLSVARLASAGATPTVKVLATTMATKSILFIASPFRRRPVTAADAKMAFDRQISDGRLFYSAAALSSRVRARLRRSRVVQCRRRLKFERRWPTALTLFELPPLLGTSPVPGRRN